LIDVQSWCRVRPSRCAILCSALHVGASKRMLVRWSPIRTLWQISPSWVFPTALSAWLHRCGLADFHPVKALRRIAAPSSGSPHNRCSGKKSKTGERGYRSSGRRIIRLSQLRRLYGATSVLGHDLAQVAIITNQDRFIFDRRLSNQNITFLVKKFLGFGIKLLKALAHLLEISATVISSKLDPIRLPRCRGQSSTLTLLRG
jgi:hypothetical protein